ncbi:MAG: AraC family transcriptional regulator [Anaerolineae bacterium]|nr:AraC family transcriptional regulator [Anaerolineae bacterium]
MAESLREQARYWRAPEFGNLELLHATFITHTYDRHFHEEYVVGMVVRSAYEFYYRRANHRACVGHIILINPGEIHTGQPIFEHGYTYRTLYPSAALLHQIAAEFGGGAHGIIDFPDPLVADAELFQMLVHMHTLLESPASQLARDVALRTALAALLIRHASYRPTPLKSLEHERSAVRQVRQYLETHYMDNPSLDQLAQIAGLSPYHLVRVFRQQTGLPPHHYLTQVRVERAKQRLQAGHPIAEVAAATGFSDQSHLTRRFKRIVGVTPGQFLAGMG